MSVTIRIVIADDHPVLVDAIASRLNQEHDLDVLARVHNADEAVAAARETEPDVVLMDVDMPGQVCFDATREIKKHSPTSQILYLSAYSHDRFIEEALKSGCAGYLTKDDSMATVIQAIRCVATGGAYYSPRIRERLVADPKLGVILKTGATMLSSLTSRELEILRYVAQGRSKKEMAAQISRSIKTVDAHVNNLMHKLDIHDRVELARYAIREGLVEP